ncbi:acyltransferase [Chryseomicrobium palamuruense]
MYLNKKDLRIPEKKFRPELEGIRAVAAILVAIFHIWLGRVSGGVDVFFIVSGYLITSTLLFRLQDRGKINYFENLLGLAKRLFPLAFLVLITTSLITILFLPQSMWTQAVEEFFASMFYFENWKLAFDSVDYLAENNVASPFQHFWALSIQGQFYITWPLLLTGVYYVSKKFTKTPFRISLFTTLLILFVTSLSYSIYATSTNQPFAYFNTFARVWEFSLGGLLVLLLPSLKFSKRVHFVMGWVGLVTILLTGMLLPVADMFPGYAALLPTMGVIFVIISAENSSFFSVDKLLNSKPLQWLGSISYGIYLWHWPLLILYFNINNVENVPLLDGLVIIGAAIALSYITIQVIEKPIRELSIKESKQKISALLSSMVIITFSLGVIWFSYINYIEKQSAKLAENELDYPGALVLLDNVSSKKGVDPIPSLLELRQNLPAFYSDPECTTGITKNKELSVCSYGELENPEYTISLVGGSHSGHWFPAIYPIAEKNAIQLNVVYKDACRFSTEDFDGQLSESCMRWNEIALKELLTDPPDLIITTANVGNEDIIPKGYIEKWKEFQGISKILALRDNPRTLEKPSDCLTDLSNKCEYNQDEVLSSELPWRNVESELDHVTFFDTSHLFCQDGICPQVIGNTIVYRDYHHITEAYSLTLEQFLEQPILDTLSN